MYRKSHNGQLSIADFHVPFGSTLDPDNRRVVFSSLMPWEELEDTYAPQFDPTTGAPACPAGWCRAITIRPWAACATTGACSLPPLPRPGGCWGVLEGLDHHRFLRR